jgi:hypothetical protein
MNFTFRNALIFLIVAVCSLPTIGQTLEPKRSITHVDGGTFDLKHGYELFFEQKVLFKKVRDEIWRFWTEKTAAQVTTTESSMEGDPITRLFFIEPDEKGSWQIRLVARWHCCNLQPTPKKMLGWKTETVIYKDLERIPVEDKSQSLLTDRSVLVFKRGSAPSSDDLRF